MKCFSILPYFIRCVELRAAERPSVWLKGTVSTSHQHIQYWCYIWYLIFSFWMILFISFLYFSQNAFDIVLKRSSHRTRECSKCSTSNERRVLHYCTLNTEYHWILNTTILFDIPWFHLQIFNIQENYHRWLLAMGLIGSGVGSIIIWWHL